MTQTHRIVGTSLLSLLLVIVGLFMVCSGRVQDIAFEDEFGDDEIYDLSAGEDTEEGYKDELLGRLDLLEEDGSASSQETDDSAELLLADNEISGESADQVEEAESFLTPELFDSMEREVQELESISQSKDRVIDSLRSELQEANSQVTAWNAAAESAGPTAEPVISKYGDASVLNSEFGMYYQDALDDFYVRNYERAIRKFRELIARSEHRELSDNCQYWIGESYFAMGNYYQAIAEFQRVLAFDNRNKADDAQLMVGIAFLKAGEADLARAELNAVLSFAGNSSSAKKAVRYLKMLDKV